MSGLELAARVAERGVDLELRVEAGGRLALLGANGAGKSTALEVLAGFLRPDAGRIALGGETLLDTAAGISVPAHRRPIALLAQEALLFPHLGVRENVAFPLRHRGGLPAREAAREADRRLAEIGVGHLASRRPSQLSGGQAQRVALARALAAEPRLLLLDEPLAALDVTAVPDLRRSLRSATAGRTTIIVTHDPLDALLLADRAAVVEGGRIVQEGAVHDVLRYPDSAFGRGLLDLNPWLATADLPSLGRDDPRP